MKNIIIKTEKEILDMAEGGKKLSQIKNTLKENIKEGIKASDIEKLAVHLISKEGAKPSFMMVPDYHWATCINVNEGLVHGIPSSNVIFKKGDLVSLDVGLYYKGFHTDTSVSKALSPNPKTIIFMKTGKEALKKAIEAAKEGNYISDISQAIESTVLKAGYQPILALSGHGVGRKLHEEPMIPCFVNKDSNDFKIVNGMVLAIEVMYTQGDPEVEIGKDGWTISMRDGKISALYEETVAVTKHGPLVLTEV